MIGAVRQPPIEVTPRPVLEPGDKVKLADTKRKWTVQGVTNRGRFVILTQPFNLKRTVLYTVIDFDRGVRGRDDMYGIGYENDDDIAAAVHMFQHTEDGSNMCDYDDFCFGSPEVSHRSGNHVRLDIESINGQPTDWAGRTIRTDGT